MAGYAVVEAADGQEALEKLGQVGVDVVLTDLDMPRMDGFELAQRLRQEARLAALPVMAIRTPQDAQDPQRTEAAGFADLQFKFDREGMLQALGRLAASVEASSPERSEVHV
ncbi:MAG: response regulator [Gemmatimonadales bacterium]